MTKINFEEADAAISKILQISEDCDKALSSCSRIDTGGISSFSPSTVSSHSAIKSSIKDILNLIDDYHSNCSASIEEYRLLFEEIREEIDELSSLSDITSVGNYNTGDTYIIGPTEDGKMLRVMFNGKECLICNTKINCFDYSKYVIANGLFQDGRIRGGKGGLASGDCLMLCEYYAIDMLSGTFTERRLIANDTRRKERGSDTRMGNKLELEAPKDENDIVSLLVRLKIKNFIYNEVSEGRPVVLQVTQVNSDPSKGGGRHFVVITGFTESVKKATDLNPSTMLSLDCLDGELNFLSNSGIQTNGRDLFNNGV